MAESSAIEEIRERLYDLIEALEEAGATKLARELERVGEDFTAPLRVRRAVEELRARCERWRARPADLPDTPKIHFAANRLEDVCRGALGSGVIVAADPSLASKSRRKLGVVLTTVLVAGLIALVPIVLMKVGVDVTDVEVERKLPPVTLPQGQEATVTVSALAEAIAPDATKAFEVDIVDGCERLMIPGQSCTETEPRLWPGGRSTTHEIKLPNQAYGLLFTIREPVLVGRVGQAKILLAATDDTPEGHYEIPLSASYLGYTPQPCPFLERIQDRCPPPREGEGEAHRGLDVPVVVVDVEKGDPNERSGEERLARAEAEEARRKAEERAKQIAAATEKIQEVIAAADKALRKRRWEEARERLDRLGELFEPLEVLAANEVHADLMPPEVEQVKLRYEAQRERLAAFEEKAFERAYAVLNAPKNRRVPEAELLSRVAAQLRISPEYLDEIYVARADEIQRRLEQRRDAHAAEVRAAQAALEARCGPRPEDAFASVKAFLGRKHGGAEIAMGECLTPRLEDPDCWVMRCDWKTKVEVAVERPKVVTRYRGKIFLRNGRVTGHVERQMSQ